METTHSSFQGVSCDVCDDFSAEAYLFVRENLTFLIAEIADVIPGILREDLWQSLYNKTYHFSTSAFFGMENCEQLSTNIRIVLFPEDKLGIVSHDFHVDGHIYQRTWSDIAFEDVETTLDNTQHISLIPFNEGFKDKFEWYIDTYVEWAHSEEYEIYKSENWIPNESHIFLKNI